MLRVFEAFAGVGSQRMALRNIGIDFEVVGISDVDRYALLAYDAIHHNGEYVEEKTEEEKTHMNLGSVYDYNKSVYDNFQPLDRIMLNLGQNLVNHFIEDTKNKYYMLLNKENADYTIFTVDYTKPAKRKSAAKILIDECIYNRGQAIDINLTEDKAAIEIWLRNAENENLCYYFFPYDAAIIEV